MPRTPRIAVVLPALLAAQLVGCGAPAASGPPVASTNPPAASAVAPPAAADTPAPTTPAATASSWVMPDLVGETLQAAQDAIQALTANGIFVTTSHDATGAARSQVLDRNWKVCSQSIRPGTRITADSRIDFGAVKISEAC